MMEKIVINCIAVLFMFLHLSHTADPVTIDRAYCDLDRDERSYELTSGESMTVQWDGEKIGKYDWSSCSVSFSGTNRKVADLKEWTLCATAEEFSLRSCDVTVEYWAIFVYSSDPEKVYNCSTGSPEKFCTTEPTLRIAITAPQTSTSNLKITVSATEDKTDEIIEDVMLYIKIGLGVAGALVLLGGATVFLCVYCKKKRSANTNTGVNYSYQPPANQYSYQPPANQYPMPDAKPAPVNS